MGSNDASVAPQARNLDATHREPGAARQRTPAGLLATQAGYEQEPESGGEIEGTRTRAAVDWSKARSRPRVFTYDVVG